MSKQTSNIGKQYAVTVGETPYTVFVYLENRSDCRASIGQKGIHIRLSKYMTEHERFDQEMQLLEWAKKYIAKNGWNHKPRHRKYRDGDTLSIMQESFLIRIRYVQDKNASKGSLKDGVIYLQLSEGMSAKQEQKHATYLVSKLIGNHFQPAIARRLVALNEAHFNKPIKKLRLRDNVSNWGSCAVDGSINISVRLLFAPPEVIDYVLIHELAHLIEHNHSDKFWKLVEKVMPGYQLADDWLRTQGERCIF